MRKLLAFLETVAHADGVVSFYSLVVAGLDTVPNLVKIVFEHGAAHVWLMVVLIWLDRGVLATRDLAVLRALGEDVFWLYILVLRRLRTPRKWVLPSCQNELLFQLQRLLRKLLIRPEFTLFLHACDALDMVRVVEKVGRFRDAPELLALVLERLLTLYLLLDFDQALGDLSF